MKKFMILYQSSASAEEIMANTTPEEMHASMAKWIKWKEKSEAAGGLVEFGMPLQAVTHLHGGKASDSTSETSGYSIVQADTVDAVTELLKDHPHLEEPGASIDVLEFLPMPGM